MSDVGSVNSRGVNYGDTVFTDKKENNISADDFLQLMVAQLKNQDFMNPVDDTQYVTQLAQFATMQQMQELAANAKQSYVLALAGQEVTAAKFKVNGDIDTVTGKIDKISLIDNEYIIYIGDKSFSLDQIMELHGPAKPEVEDPEKPDYTESNFLLSLMGKEVTVVDDNIEITGEVERISMKDGFKFMIDGEWYTLDQIKTVDPALPPKTEEPEIPPIEEVPDPDVVTDPEEVPNPDIVTDPEEVPDPDVVTDPEEVPDPDVVTDPEEVPNPDIVTDPVEVTEMEQGALPDEETQNAEDFTIIPQS